MTGEIIPLRIVSIQSTARGSYPERPRSIFINRPYIIVTQTVRIIGIILVLDELFILPDKPVQTVSGSYPERIRMVFSDRPDIITAQAGGNYRIRLVQGKTVSIILVQSVLGAEPQKTLMILENAGNRTLRKSLLDRDMFESYIVSLSVEVMRLINHTRKYQEDNIYPQPLVSGETL